MPKRPRKLKLAPSYSPWACVILAIDPGADSGAAIYDHGKLIEWKAIKTYAGMEKIAVVAFDHAAFVDVPLVVVIESHSVWSGWSAKAREGVIENVGLWKNAVKVIRPRQPRPRIIRVNVSTWRARLFGPMRTGGKRDWKAEGKALVGEIFKAMLFTDLDHNTAEAILIGYWATRAGEVGALPGVKAIAA